MSEPQTKYSEKVKGERGNWNLWARFDLTGGYLGITQGGDDNLRPVDRVLLSRQQVQELVAFLRSNRKIRASP